MSKFESGCVRFVIDVPRDARALRWVAAASERAERGTPAFYWSPRAKTASGNGVGKKGSSRRVNGGSDASMTASTSDEVDFDATRGARAGLGACATLTDAGEEDE